MVRNLKKTCNVCFKSMRGDNLKKHMKRHERENEDNVVTKGLHDRKTEDNAATNEEQISCTSERFMGLEKILHAKNKEFNRKIEMGRNIKLLVDMHGYNENMLDNDMMEALKTYKLHGKNMDVVDIGWRGWQRDLR